MQPSLNRTLEDADALYAKRSEIENVRRSVELLKRDAENTFEAAWRLGRSLFFLGQEAQSDVETRAHHAQGFRASARAVKLAPERVEGHFWLGVNLALVAQSKNRFLVLRLVWLAKRSLQRAARIEPSYHAAGPLRVLARIQHKLPFIFGGGHNRARLNFERALQLAPGNTVTRIYFAELLMDIGDEIQAREQLEMIMCAKLDSVWEVETKRDQNLARERLATMGDH